MALYCRCSVKIDGATKLELNPAFRKKQHLLVALKACSRTRDLQRGIEIHAEAMQCGCDSSMYVATALVKMYAKCGSMKDARRVFDSVKHPDVVLWTAVIMGYAETGEGVTSLDMFSRMRSQGCVPDQFTCVAALKACTSLVLKQDGAARTECLSRAKEILELCCCSGIHVQSTLMDLYVKCGSMSNARQVFDSMKFPDVVAWSALMLGYAENGEGMTALDLFARMKSQGCVPNAYTFVAALKACASLAVQHSSRKEECKQLGKQIHSEIGSYLSNIHVHCALIDMYAKCSSMEDARQAFESSKHPNVASWNALIVGYVDNGKSCVALKLFAKMRCQGCEVNPITYMAALKACSSLAQEKQSERERAECLEQGKQIHKQIGCHPSLTVQNTLIDMYAKCGCMLDAHQMFNRIDQPDVVSWTALILGYAENGEGMTALDLFTNMKVRGCEPSSVTFIAVLKACTSLAVQQETSGRRAEWLEQGKEIHLQIRCNSTMYMQSTLIDMYAKCGSMADARDIFDSMKRPDVVCWNALIFGYAENGEGATSLNLFSRMKSEGCAPNSITFAAVLKACGSLGALESGGKIHADMDNATKCNAMVVTCLVDFYVKCGELVEAQKVFDSSEPVVCNNLRTWTALLAGYSRSGDAKAVFALFDAMQDSGFRPDAVTLLCVLTCCSHAGLVDKATQIFGAMPTTYRVTPAVEHFTCMVDLLGRSNRLDDSMALLRSMPLKDASAVTWMTVLAACHIWKNVWIGTLAFGSLVSLGRASAAAYIQIANINGSRGMEEEQKMVLAAMRKNDQGWKEPIQCSWTNELGQVHAF